MPLDLEPLREFAEEEMTDKCKITRDSGGTSDDAYDETTAEYTADAVTPVYIGKCWMSTQGWQPSDQVEGGAEVTLSSFKLVLPINSPTMRINDVVEITFSKRNPHLKGQMFLIDDRIDSSHSISQNVLLHRVEHHFPR